ncbi:ion transporter, partial [Idiomarina sp.]
MYEALKGRLAALKNNRLFEFAVITVIIISALEIGAKTYELPNLVNTMLVGLDWFITVFFVVEITIRFIADSDKKHFFKNGWNVFDTLVVVVSLIP